MNNTSFIRRIDSMGRVVIPKDLRNKLNIKEDDLIQFICTDKHIEISKYISNNEINKINDYILNTADLLEGKISIVQTTEFLNNFPSYIVKDVTDRKDYYSPCKEQIFFSEEYFAFIPLIWDSNIVGILMIQKENSFDNADKLYISLLKRFVENSYYL